MNIKSPYIFKYYIEDTHNYRKIFLIHYIHKDPLFNALFSVDITDNCFINQSLR